MFSFLFGGSSSSDEENSLRSTLNRRTPVNRTPPPSSHPVTSAPPTRETKLILSASEDKAAVSEGKGIATEGKGIATEGKEIAIEKKAIISEGKGIASSSLSVSRIKGPYRDDVLTTFLTEQSPSADAKMEWYPNGYDIVVRCEDEKKQIALGAAIRSRFEKLGVGTGDFMEHVELPCAFAEKLYAHIFPGKRLGRDSFSARNLHEEVKDDEIRSPLDALGEMEEAAKQVQYFLSHPTKEFFENPAVCLEEGAEPSTAPALISELKKWVEGEGGAVWAQESTNITPAPKEDGFDPALKKLGRLMLSLGRYADELKKLKPEWTETLNKALAPQPATIIPAATLDAYAERARKTSPELNVLLLRETSGRFSCNVTGVAPTLEEKEVVKPDLDILILDNSGSMSWSFADGSKNPQNEYAEHPDSRIRQLREAIVQFVSETRAANAETHIAAVTFNSTANIICPPRSVLRDYDAPADTVMEMSKLVVGGGTNITAGIDKALTMLATTENLNYRTINFTLLTDGTPSGDTFGSDTSFNREAFVNHVVAKFREFCSSRSINPALVSWKFLNLDPNNPTPTAILTELAAGLRKTGCKVDAPQKMDARTAKTHISQMRAGRPHVARKMESIVVQTGTDEAKRLVREVVPGKAFDFTHILSDEEVSRGVTFSMREQSRGVNMKSVKQPSLYEVRKIQEEEARQFLAAHELGAGLMAHDPLPQILAKQRLLEKEVSANEAKPFYRDVLKPYIKPPMRDGKGDPLAPTIEWMTLTGQLPETASIGAKRRYRRRPGEEKTPAPPPLVKASAVAVAPGTARAALFSARDKRDALRPGRYNNRRHETETLRR